MDAFAQHRSWQRAYRLGLSQLLCLGPHTVTNLLATCGRQFVDWSADYRLFSEGQWEPRKLFRPIIGGLLELCPEPDVFVIALDDTHLRKSGKKIPGAGWGRDPLSPRFHCNLIWRQRFIQFSAALYAQAPPAPARAVPIWFEHAPPLAKPKRSAPQEEWKAYHARCRQENLCTRAAVVLHRLRQELDQDHHAWGRQLIACSDASYFNQTVLKRLPPRTTFIGRIRKDVELFYPAQPSGAGLKKGSRQYGLPAPKPEQLRQDLDHPWQEIVGFAAGKLHTFRIKTLAPVLWRKAGADRPLRVLVIAPVGYRIRKNSRMLYRQPAFLLCTDPDLPVEKMLQYYLWRWEIENDHRDEKQIVGVGQAQLTSARSVDRQPQLAVASYAMLLLAAVRAFGQESVGLTLPPPKWLANRPKPRVTTQDLIQQLRHEVWAHALDQLPGDPTHFVTGMDADTKGQGTRASLASAVLYVRQG